MALGSSCSDTRIAVEEKGAGTCQHSGLRWVNCGQLLYIPFTVYFQKTLMNGRATLLFKGSSGWLVKERLPEGDWSLQSNTLATWWVNAPYPGQEEINTLFRSRPLCSSSLSLFLWFSSVEPLLLASSLSMFLLSNVALLKLSFFLALLYLVVVRFWRFLPFIGIRFPQGSGIFRKSKVAGGVGRTWSGTDVGPSVTSLTVTKCWLFVLETW